MISPNRVIDYALSHAGKDDHHQCSQHGKSDGAGSQPGITSSITKHAQNRPHNVTIFLTLMWDPCNRVQPRTSRTKTSAHAVPAETFTRSPIPALPSSLPAPDPSVAISLSVLAPTLRLAGRLQPSFGALAGFVPLAGRYRAKNQEPSCEIES